MMTDEEWEKYVERPFRMRQRLSLILILTLGINLVLCFVR